MSLHLTSKGRKAAKREQQLDTAIKVVGLVSTALVVGQTTVSITVPAVQAGKAKWDAGQPKRAERAIARENAQAARAMAKAQKEAEENYAKAVAKAERLKAEASAMDAEVEAAKSELSYFQAAAN